MEDYIGVIKSNLTGLYTNTKLKLSLLIGRFRFQKHNVSSPSICTGLFRLWSELNSGAASSKLRGPKQPRF
jgi:hypothetical protein